ncbi:VRR-NUC domain-containing protein, partial [Pseudomonas syringae]
MNTSPLDNPFYYLENFRQALDWIARRYDDLLDATERRFISAFAELPVPAQGLLVRMVMRKGVLFRARKPGHVDIGAPPDAVLPPPARGGG